MVLTVLAMIAGVLAQPAQATGRDDRDRDRTVRFATYNASLNRAAAGQLVDRSEHPGQHPGPQHRRGAAADPARRGAAQRVRLRAGLPGRQPVPDNYLERSQQGAAPIRYRYAFTAPSNTGIPSGFDLDRNGTIGGGNDAYGFGEFPGQYGMVVLSRYPIDTDRVRTFQLFRWADMPGALLPDDPATPAARRLVLRRRPRGLPAVQQVALGRPGTGRPAHRARARLAPHAADLRRARGPQRHPQPRRDPLLGRLRHPGRPTAGSTTTRAAAVGCGSGARFVIMGDQNSDPLDGDSVDGRDRSAARLAVDPRPAADVRRRGGGLRDCRAVRT